MMNKQFDFFFVIYLKNTPEEKKKKRKNEKEKKETMRGISFSIFSLLLFVFGKVMKRIKRTI